MLGQSEFLQRSDNWSCDHHCFHSNQGSGCSATAGTKYRYRSTQSSDKVSQEATLHGDPHDSIGVVIEAAVGEILHLYPQGGGWINCREREREVL